MKRYSCLLILACLLADLYATPQQEERQRHKYNPLEAAFFACIDVMLLGHRDNRNPVDIDIEKIKKKTDNKRRIFWRKSKNFAHSSVPC